MNRERLEMLERLLLNLKEELPQLADFDMSTWSDQRSCGTAACAMGAAAMYPPFQAMGLELKDRGDDFLEPVFKAEGNQCLSVGYYAAADFFAISFEDAYQLFAPMAYCEQRFDLDGWALIQPTQVATRVRDLLTRGALLPLL